MAISPSASLIGLQVYSSAPTPKPAAAPRTDTPQRFEIEDLVDLRGERSQPGRPRTTEASAKSARPDPSSDQQAPTSDTNAAGHREAPGVHRARLRPPGSLVNILA